VQCPECTSERGESAVFCGVCGARLRDACPICGSFHGLGDRFCGSCGSDFDAILPGFTLEVANGLREGFANMGWSGDLDRASPTWRTVFRQHELPTDGNDPREYWLFSVAGDRSDWKVGDLAVNGQKLGGGWGQKAPVPVLCGTRCRLLVVNGDQLTQWPYKEITGATMRDKDVSIQFKGGGNLQFRVYAKGPRTIDVVRSAYWSVQSNTAERYLAGKSLYDRKAAQSDFMTELETFVQGIVLLGN
jgi:hypothetical protein